MKDIIIFVVHCQEKNLPKQKKFRGEKLHLFIILWSLFGKNLLFLAKLDLCTPVDNFSFFMLCARRKVAHDVALFGKVVALTARPDFGAAQQTFRPAIVGGTMTVGATRVVFILQNHK